MSHKRTVHEQVKRDEIQLFIPMRYHFRPPGRARIKNTVTHVVEDMEKSNPLYAAGANIKWCGHFGKQLGGFLEKLNMDLAYTQQFPHPVYPRERHIWPRENAYTNVHNNLAHKSQKVATQTSIR